MDVAGLLVELMCAVTVESTDVWLVGFVCVLGDGGRCRRRPW